MSFDDEEEIRAAAPDGVTLDADFEADREDLEREIAAAGAGSDPGIALLLELARAGKIDPWNVDIIKVTDKYFRALDKLDPRDLARSARCIFYAAALVHLKARARSASGTRGRSSMRRSPRTRRTAATGAAACGRATCRSSTPTPTRS